MPRRPIKKLSPGNVSPVGEPKPSQFAGPFTRESLIRVGQVGVSTAETPTFPTGALDRPNIPGGLTPGRRWGVPSANPSVAEDLEGIDSWVIPSIPSREPVKTLNPEK